MRHTAISSVAILSPRPGDGSTRHPGRWFPRLRSCRPRPFRPALRPAKEFFKLFAVGIAQRQAAQVDRAGLAGSGQCIQQIV